MVGSSKIAQSSASLPLFGLVPYKSKNSILIPRVKDELQKAKSLLQAADSWLQHLGVNLPDYQFLVFHKPQWKS
uniref:Uncharacterized protein n=1 Tax=Rhizophora mucronata TaxID=61149 RepID=A0A2P2K3X9_RHIMU